MPYNLDMENTIIHNKTHDMLPSISSTILHVRYSEHANWKSVQSSPIWRYQCQHFEAETKWPPFSRQHFKCIFLNENVWISIKISLRFLPKGPINNIPALVQIMAWRRPGDKPLSEPMLVILLTHIYASLCLNELRYYHQTSNISCSWLGDNKVDHSDVVGASPVSAAPTTSAFLTPGLTPGFNGLDKDNCKTRWESF